MNYRTRNCRKCDKVFNMTSLAQKYCSPACAVKERECIFCKNIFDAYNKRMKYCSLLCSSSHFSILRRGKGNPYYKNGKSVESKRNVTGKHLRACKAYREDFMSRNSYPFCEVCGVNQNGTIKFEVHHIYYASLYPKHPNLHDFRNLIHICIKCHKAFHGGKIKEQFLKLEKERGLKELFYKTKTVGTRH